MNTPLKQRIDEKLEHMCAGEDTQDSNTYLLGVEQTLSEWDSDADERAYHGL